MWQLDPLGECIVGLHIVDDQLKNRQNDGSFTPLSYKNQLQFFEFRQWFLIDELFSFVSSSIITVRLSIIINFGLPSFFKFTLFLNLIWFATFFEIFINLDKVVHVLVFSCDFRLDNIMVLNMNSLHSCHIRLNIYLDLVWRYWVDLNALILRLMMFPVFKNKIFRR